MLRTDTLQEQTQAAGAATQHVLITAELCWQMIGAPVFLSGCFTHRGTNVQG